MWQCWVCTGLPCYVDDAADRMQETLTRLTE